MASYTKTLFDNGINSLGQQNAFMTVTYGDQTVDNFWEETTAPPKITPTDPPPIVKPPASGTRDGQVGAGAMPDNTSVKPEVNVRDSNGRMLAQDTRVKIRVPPNYFTAYTSGNNAELVNLGAIIFPYTPIIDQNYKAEYQSLNPMHSNYTQYFYKYSSASPINITGKFSVQNNDDAGVYIATVHLLKALTKMRWGNDQDAGSPPPLCRLDAYGDYMFKNVPVAIADFKLTLPNTVDYFSISKQTSTGIYNKTTVPVFSEISVTCIPIYSRQEILNYNVTDYLNGNTKGFI